MSDVAWRQSYAVGRRERWSAAMPDGRYYVVLYAPRTHPDTLDTPDPNLRWALSAYNPNRVFPDAPPRPYLREWHLDFDACKRRVNEIETGS